MTKKNKCCECGDKCNGKWTIKDKHYCYWCHRNQQNIIKFPCKIIAEVNVGRIQKKIEFEESR